MKIKSVTLANMSSSSYAGFCSKEALSGFIAEYARLASADYKALIEKEKRKPLTENQQREKEELEQFFMSEDFAVIIGSIDPNVPTGAEMLEHIKNNPVIRYDNE